MTIDILYTGRLPGHQTATSLDVDLGGSRLRLFPDLRKVSMGETKHRKKNKNQKGEGKRKERKKERKKERGKKKSRVHMARNQTK